MRFQPSPCANEAQQGGIVDGFSPTRAAPASRDRSGIEFAPFRHVLNGEGPQDRKNPMKHPLRIVVADDEPDMRDYFRKMLPRLGHMVVAAVQTGPELVEQCRIHDPDLVMTDIQMPEQDGIDAARQIYQARPVPIILVSAHHDERLIERAEGEHILGYLVKPIKQADLQPAIAVAMRRFAQVRELEQALAHVQQLHGLLPICSYCKKIRDDQNYWQQVDAYISAHSGARFSHGICPECYEQIVKPQMAANDMEVPGTVGSPR
jgi:response regulator NasT